MARKQARPPNTLEMGSARKTPSTPKPQEGRRIVSGTTMMALRSREKKMACLALPRAWKVLCPTNWKDIKAKPKK